VYVTAVVVAEDKVPQAGEQATPFAVRLQVTPLFVESFCTVAMNVRPAVPACMEVILFVIETVMLFPLLPLPAPGLQPPRTKPLEINKHVAANLREKRRWICCCLLISIFTFLPSSGVRTFSLLTS
jgi:hypothetical protein